MRPRKLPDKVAERRTAEFVTRQHDARIAKLLDVGRFTELRARLGRRRRTITLSEAELPIVLEALDCARRYGPQQVKLEAVELCDRLMQRASRAGKDDTARKRRAINIWLDRVEPERGRKRRTYNTVRMAADYRRLITEGELPTEYREVVRAVRPGLTGAEAIALPLTRWEALEAVQRWHGSPSLEACRQLLKRAGVRTVPRGDPPDPTVRDK